MADLSLDNQSPDNRGSTVSICKTYKIYVEAKQSQ